MASHLFDLDGTLLEYHKNKWLPGAEEYVTKLLSEGHTVIFWTMRGPQDDDKEWSVANTCNFLRTQAKGIQEIRVLYNIPPGRHIYDDTTCYAHNVDTNQGMEDFQ